MQGIGVDADQAYLGDQVMTSALKKVDEAVFTAAKEAQDGTFKPGTDKVFDVEVRRRRLRQDERVGAKYTDQVDEIAGADRVRRDHRHPDTRSSSSPER